MTTHHVEIRIEGTRGQVLINGHDIARGVTGLTFKAGIDGPPQMVLDLQLIDVTEVGSVDTQVLLGNGVEETLKLLGWTPPGETAADDDDFDDDDPPVQCWHTEASSPCDWNVCRQPERLARGDYGTDPTA